MSEQRLIDANALIAALNAYREEKTAGRTLSEIRRRNELFDLFTLAVKHAPTVPAVVLPNTKRSKVDTRLDGVI